MVREHIAGMKLLPPLRFRLTIYFHISFLYYILGIYAEFDENTNIFYGDNAQGKTNILEAVYLSGTTKSHKGSPFRPTDSYEFLR